MRVLSLAVIAAILQVRPSEAGFFFQDLRPHEFKKGQTLDIHVGHLISPMSTQKYPFYNLDYCPSTGKHHYVEGQEATADESISGVSMFDDELHESFFQYKVGQNRLNVKPCFRTLNKVQIEQFKTMINYGFRFRLYADKLPSAVINGSKNKDYQDGIPLGYRLSANGEYALYNHWNIVIKTQPMENSKSQHIVGFEVEPMSFAREEDISEGHNAVPALNLSKMLANLSSGKDKKQAIEDNQFVFSYTITTIQDSTTVWETRMDHYLKFGNENIHLAAILLSIGVIITLSCLIYNLLKRGLNRDFINILKQKISRDQRRQERAQMPNEDDPEQRTLTKKRHIVEAEEVAWKKLHADVFRTPYFPNIIACFMGAGVQLAAMMLSILIAIFFAFANTQWRPQIYTTTMVVLALWGFVNGYVTSRSLKFFGTTDCNFSATISAFALPLFISANLGFELWLAWLTGAAIKYSFKNNMLRIIGWYLLNGVMCYLGAYRGYTQKATQLPSPIGKVARPIPPQPYHMSIVVLAPIFGFIQFACMYAEFSYLLDSIFRSHMYAMFGFLLINFILQILIISLLAILQTYMQLCYQNPEWWWRSFITGASGALFMAGYSLVFLLTKLKIGDFSSDACFLVYIVIFIVCYGCAAGSIAVNASYYFVANIYSRIRKD